MTRSGSARISPGPAAMPGLPALSFVNDVEMSVSDASTIYVVADNHKMGDFTPYVYESTDLGKTWRAIEADLRRLGAREARAVEQGGRWNASA